MRLMLVLTTLATAAPATASAQIWRMFQFGGTESFEYSVSRTGADGTEEGSLSLRMSTNGGQSMATVQASLGDASCSATVPVANQQAALPQLMMQCMVIAPVAMTMFTPAWGLLLNQNWTVGTSVTMNSGGNAFSFEITETCRRAGQRGVRGLIKMSGLEIDACVDPALPLPLSVRMNNTMDGETVEALLTRYEP